MSVVGKVLRRRGMLQKRDVIVETFTADLNVAAGGTQTVTFNIATQVPRNILDAGVESISFPSGLYIQSISIDKTNKTLSITLHNPGTAAITGTLTVTVVSVA